MRVRRKIWAAYMLAAALCVLSADSGRSVLAAQDQVSASSMRLASMEGTVTVSGLGGKAVSPFENMRILNGYSLETGQASYAGLLLDDTKAAKMDALSKAEVQKRGNRLELMVSEGSIFCDIKEPLESGETMNIRTSTMITGIRGTVLYIKAVDNRVSEVYVLEGSVTLKGIDPDTGEQRSVTVETGQKGVSVGGPGRAAEPGTPHVEAYVEAFTVEEIPGYVLMQVAADQNLADRLRAAGWDIQWMLDHAKSRLEEDQEAAARKLQELEQLTDTGEKTVTDQVFNSGGSDSSDGQGGGREDIAGRETIVISTPIEDIDILDNLLKTKDVTIVQRNKDALKINRNLTVPAGGELVIKSGDGARVTQDGVLQVHGTLKVDKELNNEGIIRNTGANTLNVGSYKAKGGVLENTGRVLVAGDFCQAVGSISNSGKGTMEINGTMNIISSDLCLEDHMEVNGPLSIVNSECKINGGTYKGGIQVKNSTLTMRGGVVTHDSGDVVEETMPDTGIGGRSNIHLSGGRIYANTSAAVRMAGGNLVITDSVLRVSDPEIKFVDGSGTLTLGESAAVSIDSSINEKLKAKETADGWELDLESLSGNKKAAMEQTLADIDPEKTGMEDWVETPEAATPSEAVPPEKEDPPEEKPEEAADPPEEKPKEEADPPEEKPEEAADPSEEKPEEAADPSEEKPEEAADPPEEKPTEKVDPPEEKPTEEEDPAG